MRARASATAVATASGVALVGLRSEAPLLLRQTPDALYLLGGAGGPLGGDEMELSVDVGCHASLTVRSAAATLAQPGPHGGRSVLGTRLTVGEGGVLRWAPEPLVSVKGSHHVTETVAELGDGAHLHLVEDLVLGRHDEASGRVTSRLRVTRGGVALLAHDLDVGGDAPGWSSAAVVGAARAIRTELHVGEPGAVAPARVLDCGETRAGVFPLSPGAVFTVALAPSLTAARAATSELVSQFGEELTSSAVRPAGLV